jgi:hypothetical protein
MINLNVGAMMKRLAAVETAKAERAKLEATASRVVLLRNSHDSPERAAEIDAEIASHRARGIEPFVIFVQGVKPGVVDRGDRGRGPE